MISNPVNWGRRTSPSPDCHAPQKESVYSGSRTGTRKMRNELRIAAGFVPLPSRSLYAVGNIENHRLIERTHDRKRPEIDDEIIFYPNDVPRSVRSMLRLPVASAFSQNRAHLLRRKELPLFQV